MELGARDVRGCGHSRVRLVAGPDDLGHSFWAHTPESALAVVDDLAGLAQDGVELADAMHGSCTVFIPKASIALVGDVPRTTAALQRPLTLMTTSAKLVALIVNRAPAPRVEPARSLVRSVGLFEASASKTTLLG